MDKLTTHVEFDIPDDKLGAVMRMLMEHRCENVSQRPNGTTKVGKNRIPGKMNGVPMREVIVDLLDTHGQMTKAAIIQGVVRAGYGPSAINGILTELVKNKILRRVDRGVYAMLKALPAPAKKAS